MRESGECRSELDFTAISTVGRGTTAKLPSKIIQKEWHDDFVSVYNADSQDVYSKWEVPTVIISDGAYGILGFEGDTSDHLNLPEWYEPHVAAWSSRATPQTTLWFWNSEIGWASVHPILERYGWRYVNANIWDKGIGHIAGNVNTSKIRRFPVVSEVCVQYVFEPRIRGLHIKDWLYAEWKRTGLPFRMANEACAVANVATRKYLDRGHLWYSPPPDMFERLQVFANTHGNNDGKPYFSINGEVPGTASEWEKMKSKFYCPHGFTNVWKRGALRGSERLKVPGDKSNKAVHLNQKPLDLISMIINASSDKGDVIWEPFGGLFTCSIAGRKYKRRCFGAEINPLYFYHGMERLIQSTHLHLDL